MSSQKNIAVIFAGGVGKRMGAEVPKQFLKVYKREIIVHTIEKFQYHPEIDEIYIGCVKEYIPFLKDLIERYNLNKVRMDGIVNGGETGQDTIYNILNCVSKRYNDDAIVLIHDGVRPLIDDDLITRNIADTKKYGSSITATPCFETPIISHDGMSVSEVLPRNTVYTAKAPQCFRLGDILKAHSIVRESELGYNNPMIVDSCSLMKYIGKEVHITEGNRGNIKVTTAEDYINLLANLSVEDQQQAFMLKNGEHKSE